jgi:superfamily II DNA/RNA helicase
VDLVVQFDPPNDHKDYLHRSGRTARAGATGMVIALVERGQVRELQRLHDAAGVTAASHDVDTGHHVVRQIAESGTPVPAAPLATHAAKIDSGGRSGPSRHSDGGRGQGRPAARSRDGFSRDGYDRGTATPGRRPRSAHQGQNPGGARDFNGGRGTGRPENSRRSA